MRKTTAQFACLVLLAAAVDACHSSAQCAPIGSVVCKGDKVEECVGPDNGGDVDGELKTITDCAVQGQKCMEDSVRDIMVAGCLTQACYDTQVAQCFSPGSSHCEFGQYLLTCNRDGNGCQTYVSQNCAVTGKTCVDSGQNASCSQ
jgi:hypothetical protein